MAAFSTQDLRSVDFEAGATDRKNPHAAALEKVAASIALQERAKVLAPTILEGLVRIGELFLAILAGFGTYAQVVAPTSGFLPAPLVAVVPLMLGLVLFLQSLGCYRVGALRYPLRFALRIVVPWLVIMGATALTGHLLHVDPRLSVQWLAHWTIVGLVLFALERLVLGFVTERLTRSGKLSRRTVIVGGGAAAEDLLEAFTREGSEDLHILGIFDDRTDERSPDVVGGFPKLGTVDDLVAFGRKSPIDLVIFTLPITAEQRLLVMLRKLWVLPVDIRLSAHSNKLRFRPRAYSYIGKVPVIDVFDKPLAEWDVVIKTLFDRVVGSVCLLLLAPVMLLVALAVKLESRGPVLFRQNRYGFNNETIEVFKFRSMFHDQLDFQAKKLVTRNDPRVTKVGRFIRRTSLDELPQLFNVVFKGNLSLVGPRPHAIHAKAADTLYDEVVDGYFARHRVRPGITGWAQIHGWRGETDTSEKIQKRVECDLFYIENWSIFLDLYILLATPLSLIRGKNAY